MPNFYDIADSVKIIDLTDSKFKTFRVAVKMVLPLNPKTASEYAMLTSIVSRVIKEYPEYTAFSRKLASLYGASIYADVAKMGDNQILSVALGGISGRYAFGGEKMEHSVEWISSGVDGQLTFGICCKLEDASQEMKLVPVYAQDGENMDEAIVLNPVE